MKYEMLLLVPSKLIGPITELMAGEGILLSVKQHDGNAHHAPDTTLPTPFKHKRKTAVFARGSYPRGNNGYHLFLRSLLSGPKTHEQLRKIYSDDDRAANSYSPAGTKLHKEGLVLRLADGRFDLTERGRAIALKLKLDQDKGEPPTK